MIKRIALFLVVLFCALVATADTDLTVGNITFTDDTVEPHQIFHVVGEVDGYTLQPNGIISIEIYLRVAAPDPEFSGPFMLVSYYKSFLAQERKGKPLPFKTGLIVPYGAPSGEYQVEVVVYDKLADKEARVFESFYVIEKFDSEDLF